MMHVQHLPVQLQSCSAMQRTCVRAPACGASATRRPLPARGPAQPPAARPLIAAWHPVPLPASFPSVQSCRPAALSHATARRARCPLSAAATSPVPQRPRSSPCSPRPPPIDVRNRARQRRAMPARTSSHACRRRAGAAPACSPVQAPPRALPSPSIPPPLPGPRAQAIATRSRTNARATQTRPTAHPFATCIASRRRALSLAASISPVPSRCRVHPPAWSAPPRAHGPATRAIPGARPAGDGTSSPPQLTRPAACSVRARARTFRPQQQRLGGHGPAQQPPAIVCAAIQLYRGS